MEDILKEVKEVIEVPEAIAPPEPEGGFPWCGVCIGFRVLVIAEVCDKIYKCTSKK